MGKFLYKIFPELNLCYSYFSGDTDIEDIYCLTNSLERDKTYHPDISCLVDFRNANLLFKKYDGMKYVDHIRENPDIRGERLVAFLTSTPQQTAYSIEYRVHAKELPMQIKVFTTMEACLNWTRINISNINMINDFILGLET